MEASRGQQQPGTEEPVTPREAVAFMRRGCSFLKCGARGSPHFRELKLSADLTTLSWTSPKKTTHQSTINVADIKEIRIGQNTPVFKKNRKPEHENVSFSIIYANKTLDLICKTARERDVWVQGLKMLTLEPHLLEEEAAITPEQEERVAVKFKGKRTVVEKRETSNDLYAWGQGLNGRVGHGDEQDHGFPRVVESLLGKDIRGVSCGATHTAAWNDAGQLFTWGAGQGRLGHDHIRDRFTPLEVSALSGRRVVMAACGTYHTVAITDAGRVFTWGLDGVLLGHGDSNASTVPREVAALALQGIGATWVAAGYSSTFIVTESGSVWAWGTNEKGQLGLGDRTPRMSPVLIRDLNDCAISRIACGKWHTIAMGGKGVFTWGDGAAGQLGHGVEAEELIPRQIESLQQVHIVSIGAGKAHSVALSREGEMWTWGDGAQGQLGHGATVKQSNKPLMLTGPLRGHCIVQVECGARHTAAVLDTGTLYVWGLSKHGVLGAGLAEEAVSVPRVVEAMRGKKVRVVACGKRHSAALVLHAWIADEESLHCMACRAMFTMIRRRHHCRDCGGLFCGACSSNRLSLLDRGFSNSVRVCDRCYKTRTSG